MACQDFAGRQHPAFVIENDSVGVSAAGVYAQSESHARYFAFREQMIATIGARAWSARGQLHGRAGVCAGRQRFQQRHHHRGARSYVDEIQIGVVLAH